MRPRNAKIAVRVEAILTANPNIDFRHLLAEVNRSWPWGVTSKQLGQVMRAVRRRSK